MLGNYNLSNSFEENSLSSISNTYTSALSLSPQEESIISSANSSAVVSAEELEATAQAIASQPDLTLTSYSAPDTATAGSSITLNYTLKNQGGTAAGSHWTDFYLSKDAVWDSSDTLLGYNYQSSVGAGASVSGSKTLSLSSTLASGNYYIIYLADALKQVSESNETNNNFAEAITIGTVSKPDLTLTSYSAPDTATAGSSITLNYTLKNQGGTAAGGHYTDFYLSKDAVWDSSDTLLGYNYQSSVGAGASVSGSANLSLSSTLASGNYYIIYLADALKQVSESNETNNNFAEAITIGTVSKPDLTLTSYSAPDTATAGSSITLNYTLKNQGGTAAGGHYTDFYLSKDAVWDSSDTLLGYNYQSSVGAGASVSGSANLSLSSTLASGNYYIIYLADALKQVSESNETNNNFAEAITIGTVSKPDLTLTSYSAPDTATAGSSITLNYTLKNQGGTAAGGHYTDFYLSKDAVWDSSDTLLGYNYQSSVGAGASVSGSANLSLSSTLASGNYYIIYLADALKQVSESNETNNNFAEAITIGTVSKPDLTLTSYSAPDTATAGSSITLNYTLKNQGGTAAGGHYTDFYLSKDAVWDSSDTLLGYNYQSSVGAGASVSGSANLSLSSTLASGNYYIIYLADALKQVSESNETNNNFAEVITISGGSTTPGYSSSSGYGLINAAAAVAKAIGQNTFSDVANVNDNNWGVDAVKAPEVWAKGYTGKGVVVAVLDTGVDKTHSDLDGNIWTNTGEVAGNGKDDDGNGYVDDVYGWNFISNNNNTSDVYGHGTHVAGTIAGEKNGSGVTGIAYDAKIMPVKVLSDSGSGSWSAIANGIYYAVANGADVINMSLGGDSGDSTLQAAVQYAASKGVVVVMAAGNSYGSSPVYPAAYATDWGIAVGAVSSSGSMASFSNKAGSNSNMIYVTAPGVSVYSTLPGNKYASWDGTSMATPHVAGVVALMLSAKSTLSDSQVRTILKETSGNSTSSSSSALVSSGSQILAALGGDSETFEGTDSTTSFSVGVEEEEGNTSSVEVMTYAFVLDGETATSSHDFLLDGGTVVNLAQGGLV